MSKYDMPPVKNTKVRIRNAAMALFKEKGFDNVTIDEICLAVGITKPAFYYHYKSKQDLFASYYAETVEKMNSNMAAMFSMSAYWHRLWIILEQFIDHTEYAGPDVMAQILKYSLEGSNGIMEEYFDATAGTQIEIIKKAQARKEFISELPAEELYDLSRKIILGTIMIWCTQKGVFDLKGSIRRSLETLFDLKSTLRSAD